MLVASILYLIMQSEESRTTVFDWTFSLPTLFDCIFFSFPLVIYSVSQLF